MSVDEQATIEIRMLDAGGNVVGVETTTVERASGLLVGPAWKQVPGRLVALADTVTHAEGAVNDTVSERVARHDATLAVLLKPVACELGLAGEPHLWWCYRNQRPEQVSVADLLRSTVLWVDGHALRPPDAPYNGPSDLPPRRALSGWWSLDDFSVIDRQEPNRFALDILGQRSEEFTFNWPATA